MKNIQFTFSIKKFEWFANFFRKHGILSLIVFLSVLSISSFVYNYFTGLGLLYNDARSHLDIGRRVVENLKPGFAQLGSVWLPLPHILMLLTIWNDFMWHSGLSGALQSMVSYVATGVLIFLLLKELGVNLFGRLMGVAVFALNLNILYMQSTAMTELLLMATMTAAAYELVLWHKDENFFRFIRIAFWVMLSTLIRYDGWFLFAVVTALLIFHLFKKYGYKKTEGAILIFLTLAGLGIFLWFLWNLLIFKDPLYFAFGPYSADTQQKAMEAAGALPTKHNLYVSFITYCYALIYNTNPFFLLISVIGAFLLWFDRRIAGTQRLAVSVLFAPFFFNVLALYLGHSSLYVKDLMGSWFNVRYGLMMLPTVAIFTGYFVYKAAKARYLFLGLFILISFFAFANRDAVSLDDAMFGSSGKNVREVSGWLRDNAAGKSGFVLISVASHDAIIFSSDMPMNRFIHEGTGLYWKYATENPAKWARWIVMRTHDENDNTFHLLEYNEELKDYKLVRRYPFADIYELRDQYISELITKPILVQQK